MKRNPVENMRRSSIVFVLFFALGPLDILAATPRIIEPPAHHADIVAAITSVLRDEMESKRIPAFSICLVDGEQIVWAAGFGNATANLPASAATIHRVGSVSKLFTDVALMRLVEQGRLNLDVPLDKVIPEFRPHNPFTISVTLRQLASHRAGLVREPPVGHYFDPTNPSLAETVRSLNATQLIYTPESKIKYSNAGVAVVGYALERITGKSFAELMTELIFTPLEMDDSGFELTERLRADMADGFMWSYDGRSFAAPTFALGMAPAGNLYTNVVDLGKFAIAINKGGNGARGRLLNPSTLAAMMEPQFQADPSNFGIGFRLREFDGHKLIGHNGAVYGFSTEFDLLPDRKLAVIVAASLDGCNGWIERIAHYSLRCLLAKQQGQPLPIYASGDVIPSSRARQLDGLYSNDNGQIIRLIERNGRLFMRRGEFRVELRANGDRLVQDDVFGFGTTLNIRDIDTFLLNGEIFRRRSTDQPPPELRETWRGIVGQFGWDHNELFIFEDQGQLHCLIEWFYYYPLTDLGNDQFAFPDYGLYHGERLVFDRDDSGVAHRVVAAGIVFERRQADLETKSFRIVPQGSMETLRAEAMAAPFPKFEGRFLPPDLVDLAKLDDSIQLDIRYATANNFLGTAVYTRPHAKLQRSAAEALVRAHRSLKERGYGLLIHDAYRPWHVTKLFWDATPPAQRIFVANPAIGSRHNRGCAVDLTLYDLKTGEPIDMGAGYDEFSTRSYPDYEVVSSRMRWHRELLRDALEEQGFTIFEFEWWHFDYQDWPKYPIMNASVDEKRRTKAKRKRKKGTQLISGSFLA
jgi:CubicO group peptidase (beta-lactamase class C family)/D-alanyl-D-alanine dipeptidase